MKRTLYIVLVLLMPLVINQAIAITGIGISPACIGNEEGECTYINITPNETRNFEYRVYNFEDSTIEFKVSVQADNITDRITVKPDAFTLSMHNKQGCDSSPGCQIISASVNASDLENGTYTIYISALTTTKAGGAMNINQVVKAKLLLNVLSTDNDPKKLNIIIPIIMIILVMALAATIIYKKRGQFKKISTKQKKSKK